jgi:molybdate/tungstate transport system ATP-binding protein
MQTGAPDEIFGKPVNSQEASFAGFENMLKGRVISADRGLLSIKSGTATINASGEAEQETRYMSS